CQQHDTSPPWTF
nr:immunoglobulin light chain junction region [Macaca mulatta]MOY00817.1 immunoglobulin light chain junction region [Macaca mulatta]